MPSTEKVEKVARLKERIDGSAALLLADYRGLTTSDVMELRRSLAGSATRFAVVKNTLMKRAAEDAGLSEMASLLEGPTAVGFVEGDAVAAAKQLVEAARRFPALELKGAWVEGRLLGPSDAQTLATLDSREAMLSKVAGLAKAEMSRAASMFQTLQSRFVGLLEAYHDKLPGEEAAETPATETPVTEEALTQETPADEASTKVTEKPGAETTTSVDAPSAEESITAVEDTSTEAASDDEAASPSEQEPAQPDGEE